MPRRNIRTKLPVNHFAASVVRHIKRNNMVAIAKPRVCAPVERQFSREQILNLWPVARHELAGLAGHLDHGQVASVAEQLRMALQLAEMAYREMDS
jgi:hypothetical protein